MISNTSIITKDGTPSVYSALFGATYHSMHGAMQESQHVFVKHGLDSCLQKNSNRPIRIFEMGFGTGLNCLLSIISAQRSTNTIKYHGVDSHPLPYSFLKELNYSRFLNSKKSREYELKLHDIPWTGIESSITPSITVAKYHLRVEEFQSPNSYDLIYYDAFAPAVQPELWEIPIVWQMYGLLHPGGILVTYCAQGQFFRNLQKVGFDAIRLPGPPGKREMIRAVKPSH